MAPPIGVLLARRRPPFTSRKSGESYRKHRVRCCRSRHLRAASLVAATSMCIFEKSSSGSERAQVHKATREKSEAARGAAWL